jgi:hypothetical protein
MKYISGYILTWPDDFTGMRLDDRHKISRANIKFVDIEPHIFNSAYFEEGDPFIEEIIKTGKEIKLVQTV